MLSYKSVFLVFSKVINFYPFSVFTFQVKHIFCLHRVAFITISGISCAFLQPLPPTTNS